jgi:PadR family transcriptional regulator PadR
MDDAAGEAQAMKIDRELIRGCSEMAVLRVLADGPMYGYQLAREIEQRTGGALALGHGTLYPLLYSLESKGLIEAVWKPSDEGPDRKYYSPTAKGRARLNDTSAQWLSLVRGMTQLFTQEPSKETAAG